MKTILLIAILLLQACNYKFSDTYNIVNNQTEIAYKIANHEDFDIDEAIESLSDEFALNAFKGINAVNNNNISIRNHLILSMLYYLKSDINAFNKERDTALIKINYNLIDYTIYSEGPYYYLYVEEIVNIFINLVGIDKELENFRNKCRIWLLKYVMPDGTLAPIGDSRRVSYNLSFNNSNRVVFDSEETFFKMNNLSLFIRHPSKLNKYKLNGHVHYDIGDFCIYNNDKCIVLPLGYPGNKKKIESGLDNLRYKNSIYFEDMGSWRIKDYEQRRVERTDSSIFLEYKIIGKVVSREFIIQENKVIIKDIGSDGININVSSGCKVNVIVGKDIEKLVGYHCENEEDVVQNDIVYVGSDCGNTEIEIIF